MANSPQSRKRARQEVVRRARNVTQRSRFRTYTKKARAAIGAGDADAARAALGEFVSVADSAARKGIIHRNKAARLKSKLSAAAKELRLKSGPQGQGQAAPDRAQEGSA